MLLMEQYMTKLAWGQLRDFVRLLELYVCVISAAISRIRAFTWDSVKSNSLYSELYVFIEPF
jgi:hypothetical protein